MEYNKIENNAPKLDVNKKEQNKEGNEVDLCISLGSVRGTADSLEKLSILKQKADKYKNKLQNNPKIKFTS